MKRDPSIRLLRPFWTYYGGKWMIAGRYPAPEHSVIVEPFAGAAGYATRYYFADVRLFDVDPKIVGMWSYLIRVTPRELLALPDLAPGETVHDLQVPQEARWLIGFWLDNGKARPNKQASKWMRDGGRPDSFWGEFVRRRLAAQVGFIRHWKVTHGSYESIPDMRATWFVDPPYTSKAGRNYTHDAVDFEHLGKWCRARRGQTIVCEAAGASWLPFSRFGVAGRNDAGEVYWTQST